MFNTITTNNALVNAIISNRGFSGSRINAKILDAETVKAWHALMDKVHTEAYKVASLRYNSEDAVALDGIYSAMSEVYAYIGEVNGGKLRNDENTATVLISKATTDKTRKSADLQYQISKRANSKKYLAELESTNGARPETIEHVKADILACDEEIARLESESGNKFRAFSKSSATGFYKSFEDFIADMLETRLAMTEEEVQAEAEAKRQARRAKTAAKKAQAKAQA